LDWETYEKTNSSKSLWEMTYHNRITELPEKLV
jgi:hypothetical protein